jgi:hypothetical protein
MLDVVLFGETVIVPEAIAADCGVLFEPPPPEQAASIAAVKISGTWVRRFIFQPLFMQFG